MWAIQRINMNSPIFLNDKILEKKNNDIKTNERINNDMHTILQLLTLIRLISFLNTDTMIISCLGVILSIVLVRTKERLN